MTALRTKPNVADDLPAAVDAEKLDVQSTLPAGKPCVMCGAPVEDADRFCTSCGHGREDSATTAAAVTAIAPPDREAAEPLVQKRFQCKNCGSEVATEPAQRSYTCPFCDSNYVIELPSTQTGRHDPEYIIGFAITPQQAEEKFRQWIAKNSWFRPGDLRRAQLAEKIRGVYLPFWGFSMLAQSRWRAQIGEYWWRTETYTTTDSKGKTVTRTRQVRETEWWPLEGRHHHYYSGYLVSGSRGLAQHEADRIKPFQLPAFKRYEPYFLAGWMCEDYSVAQETALEICQNVFLQWERTNVAAFLPGDTHRSLDVQTSLSHINADLCLLPAYVLSYQYKNKLFRFLVNGQTGKIAGDKPLSTKRIALVSIIAAILVIVAIVIISLLNS